MWMLKCMKLYPLTYNLKNLKVAKWRKYEWDEDEGWMKNNEGW